MKKFARIASLVLALVMVMSLAACGSSESKESQPADTLGADGFAGRTVTVGIWGGNDQETAAITKLKENFEEMYNCTVELKVYTDYNTQIQADFIGKTAPDVFYVDGSMFPFYSTLGVMDVLDPAEYELDKFYPNLVEAFTDAEGNVLCVAKDVSTLATYYNIDILESVGYTADDIPADYADYKAFLIELQAKLDETYGKNAIAAMTYNQDLARNLFLLQDGNDGLTDAEGKAALTSDSVISNMQFILDLTDAGV